MSARKRQSVATPVPSRSQNEPAVTTARSRDATIPLPAYEAPLAPLTAKAQQDLENMLQRTYPSRKIDDQLKRAASALEECTGEINDRLMEKDAALKKRKARRERDGADDMELDEKENEDLDTLKKKVDAMTDRMDLAIRKCIDGESGLTNLESALTDLQHAARTAAQQAQQQQSQAPTQSQSVPANTEPDPQVTQPGDTATTQSQRSPAPTSLTQLLNTTLQSRADAYTAQSLRTRYAQHPSYTAFKRTTFDAQHPGPEAPPMPHSSTWFAKEEKLDKGGPQSGRGKTEGEDDDDDDDVGDDIAIDRERINTRCPLTLRVFEDPVTSKRCAHSFEREAIYGMIEAQRPPTRGARAARENWKPRVKCPVAGCDVEVGKEDLQSDLVLMRRIQRMRRTREGRAGDADTSSLVGAEEVEEGDDDDDEGAEDELGEVSGEDIDEIEDD